jgi:hypothetical protein
MKQQRTQGMYEKMEHSTFHPNVSHLYAQRSNNMSSSKSANLAGNARDDLERFRRSAAPSPEPCPYPLVPPEADDEIRPPGRKRLRPNKTKRRPKAEGLRGIQYSWNVTDAPAQITTVSQLTHEWAELAYFRCGHVRVYVLGNYTRVGHA